MSSARAIARHTPDRSDPLGVLATVGGLEIAALVGVILGAVAARIPVVLDGFITGAAALIAVGLAPGAGPRLVAGHRSQEPGHAVVLAQLGLEPVLELDLRLGEGSGAALAIGLIQAAVGLRDGMATFDAAAVSGPVDPSGSTGGGPDTAPAPNGIVLVRHAPTSWSGQRYCGTSDPPLDAAGLAVASELARTLGPTLARGDPDRVQPAPPGDGHGGRDRRGARPARDDGRSR